jgi:glycosyltransferase involved in cell wall biosynthesis
MNGSAVHVLHVAQPTEYGVGRYVGDLVGAQVAAGWTVTVACPRRGPLAATVSERGARFVPWEATRGPGPAVRDEVARLRQVVATDDPDVVHLHSSKAGLAGRAAMRRARPTIFQPHAWSFLAGPPPMRALAREWERLASKWCDAIVCGSRGEQRHGARAGISAPWHVVPNAIDLDRFPAAGPQERRAARRRLGVAERPTVVCVGRLCPQKGQDVLLDAWPAVLAAVPTAQLLLVGDGPDRPSIEARALPGVRLVGHQDDVAPWLWAADIVVQPSRYETMALSMLEAMASARSVVAADIEGAREALGFEAGSVAGALVTPGDPASLSVSVIRRLVHPDLAAGEGLVGRQRAESRYHTEAVRAGLEQVVDDVLAHRTARRHPLPTATTFGQGDR